MRKHAGEKCPQIFSRDYGIRRYCKIIQKKFLSKSEKNDERNNVKKNIKNYKLRRKAEIAKKTSSVGNIVYF